MGLPEKAEQYLGTLQEKLVSIEEALDSLASAADRAADRIVSGGRFFADGDEGGFAGELCGRSGGLMGIGPAPSPEAVASRDVVIAASLGLQPNSLLERLHTYMHRGALVVTVGSGRSWIRGEGHAHLDTFVEPGTVPVVPHRGQMICPCGGALAITAAWVFVAEFVTACLRRGRVPVCWQSVGLPDAPARNARYGGMVFHPPGDFLVEPVPDREKGREYLAELHRCLSSIRLREGHHFTDAGRLAAEAIRTGATVWCDALGHHLPAQRGIAGDPALFSLQFPERGEKGKRFSPGDVYVYNGYYFYPKEELELARKSRIGSVWILGGKEVLSISPHLGEIHIDAHWRYGDTSIVIPGYDVPIIPASGVVMTATLWMMVAAAAQYLE
jgi:hypothetical protein